MAGKVEQRREALRKRLIDIAETQIARDGISGIKARDLAREAGCAVGAIYNVFGDLHDIVIAVNGRTFQRLGTAVGGALQGHEGDPPTQRMIVMAHAYLDFAASDPMMWRSLFDVRMSADGPPQWYLDELDRLFGYIAGPVAECFPDLGREDIGLMTRALFSSVHGIVLLGLENRISAVPTGEMKRMIALLLRRVTAK